MRIAQCGVDTAGGSHDGPSMYRWWVRPERAGEVGPAQVEWSVGLRPDGSAQRRAPVIHRWCIIDGCVAMNGIEHSRTAGSPTACPLLSFRMPSGSPG